MARSSSRTDSPTEMDSQDTRSVRERIVEAALELAQTVGVQGMSQARVAAVAGVRQSHLTYYFPTRADLIKATVSAIRDQMLDVTRNFLQMSDEEMDPVQGLREFCLREVCDQGKARLMLSLLVVAEEEPSLRQWNDEFHLENLSQWQEVYRQLGFEVPAEEVELFHAAFVGASLLAAQSGSEAAQARAARVAAMAIDRLFQSGAPATSGAARNGRRGKKTER
ncbi:MAG TPA: TetR family transcriptional regulator [Dongiaceae bacterium]|nr:TetR family transcriptional regulator [Dongiaceae bacterium]